MRRHFWLLWALTLIILIGVDVYAQQFTMITSEQLTFTSVAKSFTAGKILPNGQNNTPQATVATCRVESGTARYVLDGTTGTTSGQLLYPGDTLTLNGFQVINSFRVITNLSTSGNMDCIYTSNQ